MKRMPAKKRIKQLRETINHHNYRYHVLDDPELTDAAFDSLRRELVKLEREYPEFVKPDSPTQRVSGQALDKFDKVTHSQRMLSLDDVFYAKELEDWQERIQKLVPSEKLDYFAELKIDGFAISLIYKKGLLYRGATRGDGAVGEDVTQNLKTIPSIPLSLELHGTLHSKMKKRAKAKIDHGEIEIRGEVYMSKAAFEEINEERKKEGQTLYANPRNTAAGSIRQLDPKIAASRKLSFLAYDIITNLGQLTHWEVHQLARCLGFKTSMEKQCKNIADVEAFRDKVKSARVRLPYQIDGIVVSVNSLRVFRKLGAVGKAPRGAIAFKFPAKEATTKIKQVVWQVGRTGVLTPVAILEPVRIGGTLVTRATLHNQDEIERLGVKIGDTVVVQRAGDVIPDIVKAITDLRTGQEKAIKAPKICPACRGSVLRRKGEVAHYCLNKECGTILKRMINHFVSKKGFDISGLGPQIVNQLMDEGLINNPADLFDLKKGDLLPLDRFAEKSAQNLLEAINQSKNISLARFIYALGIRHVGEETAIALSQYYGSLAKLAKVRQAELSQVEDIGEIVAKSIYSWFNENKNKEFVKSLIARGVSIAKVKTFKKKLKGLTFVLTGELESLTRDQAKTKIRQLGGDVSSSVSSQTDYIVAGSNPGSKYDKAKKLKVKILDEAEFLKLL